MTRTALLLLAIAPLPCPARGADAPERGLGGRMHVVETPLRSYRLLAMSRDDDGFLWVGSIHRAIHRYDPRTGEVRTIALPFDSSASTCLCVGEKVYILGQSYPRLIIYDRRAGTFREAAYPSASPDVWYGAAAPDGQHLYLFDRGSVGVIKWDSRTDSGRPIPWPYDAPPPSGGRIEERDGALWCSSWNLDGGRYVPVGIARLDLATDAFTGFHPFPEAPEALEEYGNPEDALFFPMTLQGRLLPFDLRLGRWCRPLDVPGFGERFGFLGGPIAHEGLLYFSLSTYNGTDLGCDGAPFHFCNAILEFDPASRRFSFLTLDSDEGYYQIAYMLSAGGAFFATGTNIREPDGSMNRDRAGEVAFWQSVPIAR